MRFSRRGLILGGAAVLASCATTRTQNILSSASVPASILPPVAPVIEPVTVAAAPQVAMDPKGLIRKPVLEQGLAALDRFGHRVEHRDAMYLVDFDKHSSQPRLYRLNLQTGEVEVFRTAHGKGSDPAHTGFAQRFSNIFDSNTSSVGAYVTAGASHGVKYAENVLLDGLEPSNSHARDRAIIVHAADYCEPSYLAQHGKLGRSYGCFSVSSQDLAVLRPAMDAGRLLFAAA